jgi:cell division protein FtsQ
MIHIRQPYIPSSQQAEELPTEVVWLRRATTALLAGLAAVLLVMAIKAIMQLPVFSITRMTVTGVSSYDTQFHNAITLRANVMPNLSGHYFNVNLRAARERFEALPWIRSAAVQRVFPNALAVTLTAHVAVARWGATPSDTETDTDIERLINSFGEIFEASGGQMDTDDLPLLTGPDKQAREALALYQHLQNSLQAKLPKLSITELSHNPQGLWRAKLDNDAVLELGSGNKQDVMRRVERWLRALPEVQQKYDVRGLQSLDLRYADGFAMRMSGVTTRQGTK